MDSVNYNFSIQVTKNNGCFNRPHSFILEVSQKKEIIKAIRLKHNASNRRYLENQWEMNVCSDKIILIKGLRSIKEIDYVVLEARQLLNEILDLTNFEINVAKDLLKIEV